MGKRRKNQNRKKNDKNVLQVPCDKKVSSVLDQDKKNRKIYCSIEARKEPSYTLKSNHNSVLSCKATTDTHDFNARGNDEGNTPEKYEFLRTVDNIMKPRNISKNFNAANTFNACHDTGVSKIPGELCSASDNKPESGNQYSLFTDMHQIRAVTLCPYEIRKSDLTGEFQISYSSETSSLSESDENHPTSYFPGKISPVNRRIKPNSGFQRDLTEPDYSLTFPRNLKNENTDSDEEYSASDFFRPVFDNWYKGKNKVSQKKIIYEIGDKSSHQAHNTFPRGSGLRNSLEKSIFDGKKIKDSISCSVHAYKSSKDYFSDVYHSWLPERESTLQKLKTLKAEVHYDQLNFNKSQETFRNLSLISRKTKNSDSKVVDFFASFTAFLSDAAGGMVSVAQAFNVDSYQSKFKDIMEHDAEITQPLYKARSQCVANYHDIEEVMRKFHPDNFRSTIGKITNTLEVGKYWEGMKNAYEKDNMSQLLDVLSKFLDNACQSSKLQEISNSVERYVDDNPATLDACKSAGRAAYGAVDTWSFSRKQNSILKGINSGANNLLMIEDCREIQRLRNTIEVDSPQSKIESQIDEAIDSLESELNEIKDIYFELFKTDDSECDTYVSY